MHFVNMLKSMDRSIDFLVLNVLCNFKHKTAFDYFRKRCLFSNELMSDAELQLMNQRKYKVLLLANFVIPPI